MLTQFTRRLLASVLSIIVFVEPISAFAATRTWDAGGSDNKWSTAANWSDDTVPTALDIALFDGTGKKDATIDAAFAGTGAELRMATANTGTITVGRSLTINGNISLSGGTFRINGGNTVTVKGSWQNGGGTFASNSGTVLLAGTGTSYVLKETGNFKHLDLNDGLAGYWRFDEASGTGAIDSGRHGHTGAYKNGATRSTSVPPASFTFTNATSGSFDGVDDYVSVGTLGAFGTLMDTGPAAVSLWFKTHTTGTVGLLGSLNTGSNTAIYLIILSNGDIEWFIRGQGDYRHIVDYTPSSPVTDGEWHHIVAVKSGPSTSAMALYLDGERVTTVSFTIDDGSAQNTVALQFPIFIGAANSRGTPLWFVGGSIDDVRIYTKSLSLPEVQALYSGEQGTGSGRYTLGSDLTVNGNLNIYSGNLDASTSNYAITASGSFVNNARFTPRSGTVTLAGIGTHLKMYGTSLYNLAVAASKSAILRTAATATNALFVNSASTLTLNGNTLTATNAEINNVSTITLGSGSLLHRGTFSVSPATTAIGNSLAFTLADGDQNLDGTAAETVTIDVNGEARVFTESTAASGVFQGTIGTSHTAPVANNGIVESDDRCGIFVTGTYRDPDDTSDTATAQADVSDSAVPCEISAGGSGGGRVNRTTTPSTSIRPSAPLASVTTQKSSDLCGAIRGSNVATKSRAEKQIVALCRRRDVVIRKRLSTAAPSERAKSESHANFILGVISRLKARM